MLSVHPSGFPRRELLRAGGLGALGLTLPNLLSAAEVKRSNDASFGRAKNVIFLYLAGGPPQHETFDPKPDAPAEIRGPFQPIQTNVPGIQFCELLPRTAAMADKLAVVRSMATDDNVHSSSGHWVLTGYKYQGPNARTIQPTDWPYLGSIVKRYRPSDLLPALSSVWLPDVCRLNENVTPAGQTGGLMGAQWSPELFVGDPSTETYKIEGLQPRVAGGRLMRRHQLLDELQSRFQTEAGSGPSIDLFRQYQQQAFDLMTSGRARRAFEVSQEQPEVRDRYGRNPWGQCVLLARRLIESGVRLVHVQWPREPGDNAVDNPLWDTHAQNADRLEDVLCPIFDVGYTALLEDLDQRGLLDETLVVAIGEFGRTPKINAKGGRDHWGPVFSCALAGAGISGGQVYGSSDSHGAYPKTDRVEPGDLTATIFHLLGLDYRGTFTDPQGRELALTGGTPMYRLLGAQPATRERVTATGDEGRVPVFDPQRFIKDSHFRATEEILTATEPARPKGWRVYTSGADATSSPLIASIESSQEPANSGRHAVLGCKVGAASRTLKPGDRVMLAQEVRSPFAGTYEIKTEVAAVGSSSAFVEALFREQLQCRLVYFQLTDAKKKIADHRELASQVFTLETVGKAQEVRFQRDFFNPNPGQNFSFGLGLGIGVSLEKRAGGPVELDPQEWFALRVAKVELQFTGKKVDEKVVV